MKCIFSTLIFLFIFSTLFSQEEENWNDKTKSFLIIKTTTSYERAVKLAKLANNKLQEILEFSSEIYETQKEYDAPKLCGCGEYHDYYPRGRSNGNFISIEQTSAYNTFTPGYYVVIAGVGNRKDMNLLLSKINKHFPQAYVKNADVYMGCTH